MRRCGDAETRTLGACLVLTCARVAPHTLQRHGLQGVAVDAGSHRPSYTGTGWRMPWVGSVSCTLLPGPREAREKQDTTAGSTMRRPRSEDQQTRNTWLHSRPRPPFRVDAVVGSTETRPVVCRVHRLRNETGLPRHRFSLLKSRLRYSTLGTSTLVEAGHGIRDKKHNILVLQCATWLCVIVPTLSEKDNGGGASSVDKRRLLCHAQSAPCAQR